MNFFPVLAPDKPGVCLLNQTGIVLRMDDRFAGLMNFDGPQQGMHISELLPLLDKGVLPQPGWIWGIHANLPDEPDTVYLRCRPPRESDLTEPGVESGPESGPISGPISGTDSDQRVALRLYCDTVLSWFLCWNQQTSGMILRDLSHRFGNSLSSIMGFADIIRQRGAGIDDPFALRALNNIFRGCEQMRETIADIQVLGARVALEAAPLELGEWLEQSCAELAITHPPDFFLQAVKRPGGPCLIQADAARLRALLQDLWDLAQRASVQAAPPESGKKATDAKKPEAAFSVDRLRLPRTVPPRDTGIPAENTAPGEYVRLRMTLRHLSLRDLHDLAHRVGSIPPPEGDSPLPYGMNRIRGTAQLHGGFHEILSAPGYGCIIDVYLPV